MLKLLNESDLSTLLSNAKSNMKILDGQISSLNKEWPHHVNLIGFLKKSNYHTRHRGKQVSIKLPLRVTVLREN